MDDTIEFIAGSRHIAVVGVSDKKMGGAIYKTLKDRGVAAYAVHPRKQSFQGDTCYGTLRDVPSEVRVAILAVSPEAAEQVVDDACSSGVTHLWFQQGKDFSRAIAKAQAKGLQTVSRKCILMYVQPVGGVHAFHRCLVRIFGKL